MKARYRFRCYPTPSQKLALAKLFGCVRVVWNDALAFCVSEYKGGKKKPKNSELQKQFITQAKKLEEREWLSEVSSVPLQQSLNDLEQAYSNFFASCKGNRKGQRVKPPKFKKRKSKQSARFVKTGFSIKGKKVYLAKVGNLEVVWSRELPSEASSVTLIKDSADRYFLSFVVEIKLQILPESENSVGIDLGIKTFATLSNGQKIEASKPLKKRIQKLRKFAKQLSRKTKGSKRREKARKRLAKLHAKLSDTRTDFLHKLSTQIIRENQAIVLEDLNVSGLVKNRKLSRAISDLGWRTFRTFLESKSEKYGRDFRVINRWEPTSQQCSCCGFKIGKLDLSIREWICLNCGESHDRDVNAANNILVAGGLPETLNGRGDKQKTTNTGGSSQRGVNPPEFQQLSIFDLLK
ncbi:RNA-guided endonuclease TnpB family protein [Planktothrix sp. FACHB-1365]|uniref:RNA-guided endonuclease InsQ/TnpB family protein n=1 Tax=Planktothrix sp. FACHB-1365 TaxID=2692855 RepID=UPI001686C5FB|nr:RNA-guided endonuclease TnpB family protein [Planktothrix sp. FACHB-1365]MBD2485572.1 IS200/IS605 family element transposase accessory protein TnpB [Planktothrix sp. FACHB-1365]